MIKDLVTCYNYINGFTDVDIHHFSPGLAPKQLQIQLCQTVLTFLFLILLCSHGIPFPIFVFLFRILS